MKALYFVASLFAVLKLLCGTAMGDEAATSQAPNRPNIVFILADDFGIDGLGCYGSDRFKNKTPNLDALAMSGARFERCYAAPVCGPSRCLFVTGRYAFRTGGLSNDSAGVPTPKVEPTVARILREAGYTTGMAGKWRQMSGLAGEWGFDDYRMSDVAASPTQVFSYTENGKSFQKEKNAYYPNVQQAFALEFLRRHRDKPFFLYYASHLVHDPIVATPDTQAGEERKSVLYDDNVAYLDKQVGELVAELDKLGLRERTLIVFSGDNGTDAGDGPIEERKQLGRSSTIGGRRLHGGKRDMTEGGVGVPLIVNWKGTLPGGRLLRDLVDFTDLLPTFAEFGGAMLPSGVTFDGRSFAPQLRGEKGMPREWVFSQLDTRWFVRNDEWKLNERGELYEMRDAPFVEKKIANDTTDSAAIAARKRLQTVLAELNPAGGKTEPPPNSSK